MLCIHFYSISKVLSCCWLNLKSLLIKCLRFSNPHNAPELVLRHNGDYQSYHLLIISLFACTDTSWVLLLYKVYRVQCHFRYEYRRLYSYYCLPWCVAVALVVDWSIKTVPNCNFAIVVWERAYNKHNPTQYQSNYWYIAISTHRTEYNIIIKVIIAANIMN